MDICIIGAGPAGCYTGYLLAKQGHNVKVFEKNKTIGSPVQCTGILSDSFPRIMSPDRRFVLNTVTKTRIYSPNKKFLEARIKKNYVISRKKFDVYLSSIAEKEGARFYTEHTFKGFSEGKKLEISLNCNGKSISQKADILIGADGPLSPVAKAAGIFCDRKFLRGKQLEVIMDNDNAVEFYPYIGCYAWIVPVNKNTARIGVAAYKNTNALFKRLFKGPYKVIENQSGVIPLFNPRQKARKGNVFLVGDAATFNKATSGGGVIQALKSAEILADCIIHNKEFDKEWRRSLYRGLHFHLILHKIMQRFTDKDWDNLVRKFSDQNMKKILYHESRDKILKMGFSIALKDPMLVKYLKYAPLEEIKNLR